MERCPICRATLGGATTCRRCRADLSGAATAAATARALEVRAMERLARGNPDGALRLLLRARLLHRTAASRALQRMADETQEPWDAAVDEDAPGKRPLSGH